MLGIRPASILYVDNDVESCELLRSSLLASENDFEVVCVTGTDDAIDLMRQRSFDMYILEYCLAEMTGPELCRKLRLTDRRTPIVIYSALFRQIDREKALDAGANAFVVKSDGFSNLSATILRLLYQKPVISRNYHSARRSTSIF